MVEVEVRGPGLTSEWAIETGACVAWLSDRLRRCILDTERRRPFTSFFTPPLILEVGENLAADLAALDREGEERAGEEDDILGGGTG